MAKPAMPGVGHQIKKPATASPLPIKSKTNATPKPAVQAFEWRNREGEKGLSAFSISVLDSIRRDAGVQKLVITSVARSARQQAEIMYDHEIQRVQLKETLKEDVRRLARDKAMLDPHDAHTMRQYRLDIAKYKVDLGKEPVNYRGEGANVQAIAQRGLSAHDDRDVSVRRMTDRIISAQSKGHSVSTHLGRRHLEVADISLKNLNSEQRKKLLSAIRNRFHGGVFRVGHPNGPRGGQGTEFNDHDCYHVEILQVQDFDAKVREA
jgi:hypothetical protein